jgi:hypothetical protein
MGALYSYERETMEDRIQELENEREEFEGLITDVLGLLQDFDFDNLQEAIEMLEKAKEELK